MARSPGGLGAWSRCPLNQRLVRAGISVSLIDHLRKREMTEQLSRNFEDQLVRIVLFLVLFSAGVLQLFFVHGIRNKLLRLREHMERLYQRHPMLLRLFGPPLRRIELRGYTVGKRIGGAILIILSLVFLISAFLPPDPCDDHYWSITRRHPC